MRPDILFPLFESAQRLAGVGPKVAENLERLTGGGRVVDLLWHRPSGLVDRRYAPQVAEAAPERVATLTLTIGRHLPGRTKRQPYKIQCSDETGKMTLVFFHGRPDYLKKTYPEGEIRVVSGRLERFGDELQMTHPDRVGPLSERDQIMTVEPVYPMTQGLAAKTLRHAISEALGRIPEFPEWQDAAFLARQDWPPARPALETLHAPGTLADLEPGRPERRRLAFDELLANQLALGLMRQSVRRQAGRALAGDGALSEKVLAALPYRLTGAQKSAIRDIEGDMGAEDRMLRLIQGDVGSGKTVVALLAMARAAEAGTQSALLAPTEILARQHAATIQPLAQAAGLRAEILTGRDGAKHRRQVIEGLASGDIQIVIGTHALLSEDVAFTDLGLAVIDEQHRFGVDQRLALGSKGKHPDVLVMTATPIPRTLMLTAYGDMEVSRLHEKPPGRQPVDTRVLPLDRLGDVLDGLGRAVSRGEQVFWVCPLVEESDVLDMTAAEDRYAALKEVFGDGVALVHGRQSGPEKDAAMEAFKAGSARILVATTVIEVGVDVPAATVLVLENAERFGLAQMHQLRGRIGRGSAAATCLLLYARNASETARARLRIMRETEDGFRIAEEDLKLRGAGELLGTRQSGLPQFRIADLGTDADLLAAAQDDAKLILATDPGLTSERGQALRVLLYLFERDAAVRTLRSG